MKTETTESRSPVAEMQGVCLSSSGFVDGLSFECLERVVYRGDFVVVVGGSGSGKSRIIESLAGLARPSTGTLRLFGQDTAGLLGDDWAELRRRVGIVFEEGSRLFPQMSVYENVALPLCYHQDKSFEEVQEEVGRLFEFMGMTRLMSRLAGRIGRDWRPRVGLARAIVTRPEFLLVDNPLAGLDPEQATWWVEFLGALAKGHAWYEGQAVTVLATAEDSGPWKTSGCQLTYLREGKWVSDTPAVRNP